MNQELIAQTINDVRSVEGYWDNAICQRALDDLSLRFATVLFPSGARADFLAGCGLPRPSPLQKD